MSTEFTYTELLEKLPEALEREREQVGGHKFMDSGEPEITRAIVRRMRIHYRVQDRMKTVMRRKVGSAGAGAFVDAVAFYVDVALRSVDVGLDVQVERSLRIAGGSVRPDITIWHQDSLVAFIECKTQLGWNRKNWARDFDRRCELICSHTAAATGALVVMTGENWGGLDDSSADAGVRHFVLSDLWPSKLDLDMIDKHIVSGIEPFVQGLLARVQHFDDDDAGIFIGSE